MKKGFTLVELMIVIAIVAILAALLIPACSNRGVQGVGIDSSIGVRTPTPDNSQGKLKLIGETNKTKLYEFIDSDHRNCVMVESKYVDEDTTITCN